VAQRRDAMVAAARMIVAGRDLARERGDLKTMTGVVTPEPGSINVIPELVTFSLDLRARDEALVDAALAEIRQRFDAIAAEERVSVTVEEFWRVPPTTFDAAIKDRAERLCRERGYPVHRLVGTIGHDSAYLARVTRAAMLFTPTVDGLSHCPTEDSPWPDIERATDVLFSLAVELANEPA
jgi:acetylornithine deacetylase/succinyl-diaminopimelate desuccinylase-like protein